MPPETIPGLEPVHTGQEPMVHGARSRSDAAPPVARAIQALPPPFLVLLSILSIQVGAALAVKMFPLLGPVGTVFLRIGFSALLLMAVSRPRLDDTLRRHAGLALLYGLVIGGMNLCFYEAIARIPLGIAVTIEFIGPLGVAVATSRRLRDFLWIGLAVIGLIIMTPSIGSGLDPLGVGFALVAGSGWASFILVSRRVGRVFPRGTGLALGMAVAAFALLPLAAVSGAAERISPMLLVAGLVVAVLATTIPLSLEFEALKRLPPRTYGMLVTLEPAVATLIGIALLGETLGFGTLLAVACVTVAALGMTVSD